MNANQEDRRLTSEERDDVLESLRTIDQRSRSLKEFVQNFRAVNQIPEPHVERIGLAEMVRTSTHLFSKELETANIKLVISPMDDVQVFADRNLTQQVLINLVKNAVESMSNMIDHKMIEVSTQREGHRFVHLRVRDTGGGIATDDLDQIFIPFYSTKKGGSGIGLSISQQIMQRQKGDISVKSELGRGSEFTLTFSC
jgi:signal transduction histidine kinase